MNTLHSQTFIVYCITINYSMKNIDRIYDIKHPQTNVSYRYMNKETTAIDKSYFDIISELIKTSTDKKRK